LPVWIFESSCCLVDDLQGGCAFGLLGVDSRLRLRAGVEPLAHRQERSHLIARRQIEEPAQGSL
jgi:hypothetical protein